MAIEQPELLDGTGDMEWDWDLRARANARYYIECSHYATEQAFDESGRRDLAAFVLRDIELDGEAVVLEIGCGLGRLLQPLAAMVQELHGVDVSGEMLKQARARLAEVPNVHLHKTSGADLRMLPDRSVDFCYSFITFQHVPAKRIVHAYVQEVARVLKPGGIFRFQVDGRAYDRAPHDNAGTWYGVVFDAEEIRGHLVGNGFRLLNLSGVDTQYMLVTAMRLAEPASLATPHVRYTNPPWDREAVRAFVQRLCPEQWEEKAAQLWEGVTFVRRLANEFLQRTQGLAAAEYVREVYAVFLRRPPDEAGFRYAVDRLNTGELSRERALEDIIAGAEFDHVLSGMMGSAAGGDQTVVRSMIDAIADDMVQAGITENDDAPIQEIAQALAALGNSMRQMCSGAGDPLPNIDELPKAWLTPAEEALIPPRHLWSRPQDSISHYYRWVWEYLAYLTLLCDLQRDSRVLELGCGHGWTARGLLDYLREPGGYRGLDIDRTRIIDAQVRLQRRHPLFQFIWADVYNTHDNPQGRTPATAYVFPFPDASFDVLYAASLFTHLLPEETRNYLRESRRVLKPGGKCLFSLFMLDHYRGHGTTVSPLYEFVHAFPGYPGVAVRDLAHPDALISYSVATITAFAEEAGLKILRVIPGLWSHSQGFAVHEQDLILLGREG